MKNTKMIVCFLLALCMMLSLCACAGESKTPVRREEKETETERELTLEEQLIGTWDMELDVTDMIVDGLSETLEMDLSEKASDLEMIFYMTYEFEEDNSCKLYFDEDMMADSMDDFIDDLCPIMVDITYEMLEAEGFSKEDSDSLFESQYGTDIESYYEQELAGSIDLEDLFGELPSIESTYKLEGNMLTIAVDGEYGNDSAEISIDGDTMTIDGALDESIEETFESLGISLPLILERR